MPEALLFCYILKESTAKPYCFDRERYSDSRVSEIVYNDVFGDSTIEVLISMISTAKIAPHVLRVLIRRFFCTNLIPNHR